MRSNRIDILQADIQREWEDIQEDLASLKRKFKRVDKETDPEVIDSFWISIGTLCHSIYCGFEATLERMIDEIDGGVHKNARYHKNILKRAFTDIQGVRPSIIREKTFVLLDELRGFRHAFRNLYIQHLKEEHLKRLVPVVLKTEVDLKSDLSMFFEKMSAEKVLT